MKSNRFSCWLFIIYIVTWKSRNFAPVEKNIKIVDIRSLSFNDLQERLEGLGEKKFRARQIYEWLWMKSCVDFDQMSNLSKELREKLKMHFCINPVSVQTSQLSDDRTIKNAFRLFDSNIIEGVLIPTTERMTACVSSQVGCSLSCKFCATGYMDRKRNVNADEIYDQVVLINRQAEENYKKPLTNIVYMGMGEPLLNYSNVLRSIDRITAPDGLNIASRRITVSTAGIAKMIKKLGDDEVRFNLALSLHAANDKKRDHIMAINETNNLEALADALRYFYGKTGTRVTYEYIIFKDFNDELEDAQELAEFCKIIPCKVNIIEYNTIDDGEFQQADPKKVDRF